MYVRRLIALIITFSTLCGFAYGQEVKDSVKIYFRQGSATLDTSIGNNKAALRRIADSLAVSYTDSLYRYFLQEVTVIGGASPEGSLELNRRLSEARANSLFDYLPRYNGESHIEQNFIYLGRDWQGLLQLVLADAKVPHRDEVIGILQDIIRKSEDGESAENDFYRLRALKGGVPYRYLSQRLFHELRATRLIVSYGRTWIPVYDLGTLQDIDIRAIAPEVASHQLSSTPIYVMTPPKPRYMALKTNMLYDIALTPNIGAEVYLGRDLSVAANWMYAWWGSDTWRWYWRTYGGDVSLRWWFGSKAQQKPLTGHHAGLYGQVLTYDLLWGEKGYMAGEPGGNIFDRAAFAAGLEYGYSLPITRRMNIDFTLGMGYMWGIYYEYTPEDDCYVWQTTKNRRWLGPTKAEVSLVWQLGRSNINEQKGGLL